MNEATTRRFGQRLDEKGYILAMSALLLIPMLAFTGFATDVGAWHARASRMQRAADAASLAGVVWQPSFDRAEEVALEAAERNGFVDGQDGISIVVSDVGPRQLGVEITDAEVEVYFTAMFFEDIEITRDAVAEYLQSLPMGSPDNHLGNDPVSPTAPDPYPNLWLNVAGRNATKVSGDKFTAAVCGNGAASFPATGCSTGSGYNSEDYTLNGHIFSVNVEADTSANPFRIQVYDPAYTYQGDFCENNAVANDGAAVSGFGNRNLANLSGLGETTMNDAATRYAAGQTKYCAGDQQIPGGVNMTNTTYIVRGPDDTPYDNLDNDIVCQRTFDGRNIGSNEIWNRLRETTAYDASSEWGTEQVRFRAHFRQWYTLCEIAQPDIGRYIVQVIPNTTSANREQSNPSSTAGGHNRFALRAGFGGMAVPNNTAAAVPDGSNIGLYGEGRLPIYTNAAANATTNFYLARITPEYAGEVILLSFYDIGDVGSGSVDFDLLPPEDSNVAEFSDCEAERDGPAYTVSVSGCGVTGMTSANFQGREVSVQIPIPGGYTCDEEDRAGCWIRIALSFSDGANPSDTTTWTASVLGDPVRLIE
jgi:hypothetical protein